MNARGSGDLLALDPSISSAGAALFRSGELISAKRIQRKRDGADIGQRCLAMAQDIAAWAHDVRADPRCYAFEWPQIYTAVKSEGDPNDLIGLAGVGSALAGILWASAAARNIVIELATPTPAEWAGQLPKSKTGDPWASPRGARIASRLSPHERARVPAQHDILDAVAIGLWALGRFDRIRVLPGAT